MQGYIYLTTNLINGKKYVGKKTSDIFLGEKYLGSGTYLKNAVKKYGKENFKVEMLESVDDKALLTDREIYWIDHFNAVENDMFYNQTRECSPGRDGIQANFDSKKLMSYKAKLRCQTEERKRNLKIAAIAATKVEGRNEKISNTLKKKYESGEIKPYWKDKTRISVYKDGNRRLISSEKLDEYLQLGWTKSKN